MKSDWPVNPLRPSDVNHPKGVKMMKNEIKWKTLTGSLSVKAGEVERGEALGGGEEKHLPRFGKSMGGVWGDMGVGSREWESGSNSLPSPGFPL